MKPEVPTHFIFVDLANDGLGLHALHRDDVAAMLRSAPATPWYPGGRLEAVGPDCAKRLGLEWCSNPTFSGDVEKVENWT